MILSVVTTVLYFQKKGAEKREFQAKQETRVQAIKSDSLKKVSDGYYQKLVADTLTQKQLKKLAAEITELKNRKPVSVTKTIIQPVRIEKEIDSVSSEGDSIFIEDHYPNKVSPFLRYTNRLSLTTLKGESAFTFNPISLSQVVTKKEDGLYQVDFKAPDFLEVKSLDIQTEPQLEPVKDNWGTLIGLEYGKNLDTNKQLLGINVYERYKKFYFGGSVTTNKDFMGGFKIEF